MQRTFRVVKEHRSSCQFPLSCQKGERLSFERRESEWEGWLWCTHSSGRSGWVPENWLELEEEMAVLQRDYSALELTVSPGQVLSATLYESGWVWATTEHGEGGWVPLENLSPWPEGNHQILTSDL